MSEITKSCEDCAARVCQFDYGSKECRGYHLRRMELAGWSCDKLENNGIVEPGDALNETKVKICTDAMHTLCLQRKGCVKYHHPGTFWRRRALGLEGTGPWTVALAKKYQMNLNRMLKKCRCVNVLITEET